MKDLEDRALLSLLDEIRPCTSCQVALGVLDTSGDFDDLARTLLDLIDRHWALHVSGLRI